MSEKDLSARLSEPKCRCGQRKRILTSGIMVCGHCDLAHQIPNAWEPGIRPAWPEKPETTS